MVSSSSLSPACASQLLSALGQGQDVYSLEHRSPLLKVAGFVPDFPRSLSNAGGGVRDSIAQKGRG